MTLEERAAALAQRITGHGVWDHLVPEILSTLHAVVEDCARVADADAEASRKTIDHHKANGHSQLVPYEEGRVKACVKVAERIRALKGGR